MDFIFELLVSGLIVIGGFFVFVGSLGMIKFPDLMTRLHGPTKATTLGMGGVLVASMLYFAIFGGDLSIHEILITIFLFLTAPVSAHFIAKSFLHENQDLKSELPPTRNESGWGTYHQD